MIGCECLSIGRLINYDRWISEFLRESKMSASTSDFPGRSPLERSQLRSSQSRPHIKNQRAPANSPRHSPRHSPRPAPNPTHMTPSHLFEPMFQGCANTHEKEESANGGGFHVTYPIVPLVEPVKREGTTHREDPTRHPNDRYPPSCFLHLKMTFVTLSFL